MSDLTDYLRALTRDYTFYTQRGFVLRDGLWRFRPATSFTVYP